MKKENIYGINQTIEKKCAKCKLQKLQPEQQLMTLYLMCNLKMPMRAFTQE